MKSYTDLKQSAQLALLLPAGSSDMWWNWLSDPFDEVNEGEYDKEPLLHKPVCYPEKALPCWSLAALIDALPLGVDIHNITDGHKMYYYVEIYTKEIYMKLKRMNKPEICLSTERHENLVDACYEMILKLKEKDLL